MSKNSDWKSVKFGRRGFLGAAFASAATGYSMIISAPQVLAKQTLDSLSSGKFKEAKSKNLGSPDFDGSCTMKQEEISCDLLVAGGGLSGVCAALSAARKGLKVVLIQDRSHLGGNASSEIRMHPLGVPSSKIGWREGGIIEELKLENAMRNPQLSWDVWDLILYDKVVSESNIRLILDTSVYAVKTSGKKIKYAYARCDCSRMIYKVDAKYFADCTGDARLAAEAGATLMSGREGSKLRGESLADYDAIGTRQGSSLMITTREYDKPMPFGAPKWAKKITEEQLKYRKIGKNDLAYGYWWVELGGVYDAIADNEMLRFELLSIVMGVWDYVKNSGKYPNATNLALDFVGMLPGRRDTFRIEGERVLTQRDIESGGLDMKEAVAVGGWTMDDHPAEGFYAFERKPCRQYHSRDSYNIPLGSLISKDFSNLMMAGRNVSCSHVAFTSTRVMCTCAAMGQAVGTCVSLAIAEGKTPSELRATPDLMERLRQILLRDDQTILGAKNADPADLARKALLTASNFEEGADPKNVVNGLTLGAPKMKFSNEWAASVSSKPWIQLDWLSPVDVSRVRLCFNSGSAMLTQTGQTWIVKSMMKSAPSQLVRDYRLTARLFDDSELVLADVKGNYQKLVEHSFPKAKLKSIRLTILATNGDPFARIREIRVEET